VLHFWRLHRAAPDVPPTSGLPPKMPFLSLYAAGALSEFFVTTPRPSHLSAEFRALESQNFLLKNFNAPHRHLSRSPKNAGASDASLSGVTSVLSRCLIQTEDLFKPLPFNKRFFFEAPRCFPLGSNSIWRGPPIVRHDSFFSA